MRLVRYAKTFERDLMSLIAFGAARFGKAVAEEKTWDVATTIVELLAPRPKLGKRVPDLKLYMYEMRSAPLTILYDFDADELRVHTIVHARSNIPRTDLTKVVW